MITQCRFHVPHTAQRWASVGLTLISRSGRRAIRKPAAMSWLSPSRRYRVILNWVNGACNACLDATVPRGLSELMSGPRIAWLLRHPQHRRQVPGSWSKPTRTHRDSNNSRQTSALIAVDPRLEGAAPVLGPAAVFGPAWQKKEGHVRGTAGGVNCTRAAQDRFRT